MRRIAINNYLKFTFLIIFFSQFSACIDELVNEKKPDKEEDFSVNISFFIPEHEADQPVTRLSVAQESDVNEVLVVWFNQAGVYVHKAVGLELDDSGSIRTCRVLMNDGVYDIMVFANCANWFDLIYPSGIPANITKDDILNALVAESTGAWTDSTIPMWGLKEGVAIDKNNDSVTGITLTRGVVRVDVKVDSSISPVFELEEVSVYRNYQKGRLVPILDASHWDNSTPKALQVSLPVGADLINNTGKSFAVSGNKLEREIYLFETPAGEDISNSLNDQNPCLILKAKFNGGSSTYYRVDFTKNSLVNAAYIELLRNNIYEINITGVDRDGAGSTTEALKGRPANITYDISDLSKSGMNNIAWNGQHYLMASADTLYYWKNASSQVLRVQTNHASGWKVSSAPSWVTVSPDHSEYTAETQVTVTVQQNSTVAARTGQIILTAGELELDINIEQSNLEELSLTVDPVSLIFYDQPLAGQIVNITTVPASLTYSLTQTGDISYRTWPGNTSSSPTLSVWPNNNTSGSIQTGIITVSITHTDGRTLREEIAVRQYPGNNPFQVMPDDPYQAIKQDNATMSVTCTQDWYVKRSIPAGAIQLAGVQPAGTAVYNFSISANNSYTPRDITVVFATNDDMYEYEFVVNQEGVTPYFYFQNAAMNNEYEYEFTGVAASSEVVGFDLNFPWRLTETGLNSIISSMSHQVGTVYPVEPITEGKQESITFTSIDYTNRTGMPAAGTTFNSTAYIYNMNTDPYPSAIQGTIKFNRVIPSVFDLISTSIAPDVDVIPRQGGTISLTAGSNDDWSIRATNGLTVPSLLKGLYYEVNTLSVNIPGTDEIRTNENHVLNVDIYYEWNGQQVLAATYPQNPYRVIFDELTGEFFQSKNNSIYGVKDVAILDIKGDYPALFFRLAVNNNPLSSVQSIPAGSEAKLKLDVPENLTGGMLSIWIQYSTDGTNWVNFSGLSQYPNNYFWNTVFYAKDYATENSSKLMTWAEAMGIDPIFNTITYYNTWPNTNRENVGYIPDHNTGCVTYSETAFPNNWRLPTSIQLQEMLRQQINGEYDFGINSGEKFHCSYDNGNTRSKLYWIENGQIMSSEGDGNKNTPAYVRCVFRPW